MKLSRINLFKSRFDIYYPFLCKIALSYISDRKECEDIVQEVFISVWQKNRDSLTEKEFISYMVKSVKNNCISFLRKQKNEVVYIDELATPSTVYEDTDEERQVLSYEERLTKILAELPPKCREVFIMSKLQKMKYKEISIKLNISEKTVENHIGKAFKIIRENMRSSGFLIIIL